MFSSVLVRFLPSPKHLQFLGRNFAWWYYYDWLERIRRQAARYHSGQLAQLDVIDFRLREQQMRSH